MSPVSRLYARVALLGGNISNSDNDFYSVDWHMMLYVMNKNRFISSKFRVLPMSQFYVIDVALRGECSENTIAGLAAHPSMICALVLILIVVVITLFIIGVSLHL
jgi:hypothetical protein